MTLTSSVRQEEVAHPDPNDVKAAIVISSDTSMAEMFIDIEPMFLTKEEYFYGFTADSDPAISIDHWMSSDIEGEMNAKDFAKDGGSATLGSLDGGEEAGGRKKRES